MGSTLGGRWGEAFWCAPDLIRNLGETLDLSLFVFGSLNKSPIFSICLSLCKTGNNHQPTKWSRGFIPSIIKMDCLCVLKVFRLEQRNMVPPSWNLQENVGEGHSELCEVLFFITGLEKEDTSLPRITLQIYHYTKQFFQSLRKHLLCT